MEAFMAGEKAGWKKRMGGEDATRGRQLVQAGAGGAGLFTFVCMILLIK